MNTIQFLEALSERHDLSFVGYYDKHSQSLKDIKGHLSQYITDPIIVHGRDHKPSWSRSNQIADLFKYRPRGLTWFCTANYEDAVRTQIETGKPDLIICNTILAGQVLRKIDSKAKKILNVVDILAMSQKRTFESSEGSLIFRISKYLGWKKTTYYERAIWNLFDGFVAISDEDARIVSKALPSRPVTVIPTAVSLPSIDCQEEQEKDIDLLFVGSLGYPPNIDALQYFDQEILPRLIAAKPNLRVAIVGSNVGSSVKAIVEQCGNYSLFSDVEDVMPYYLRSRAAFIPMRVGSGIKVKLLEAMSYGVPVVTTSIGAFGIPVANEREVFIADPPDAFADRALELLQDSAITAAMGARGRELVMREYDRRQIGSKILEFVEHVCGPANSGAAGSRRTFSQPTRPEGRYC
jgi:glycosyltransferase involved in cell wall biosynthesis